MPYPATSAVVLYLLLGAAGAYAQSPADVSSAAVSEAAATGSPSEETDLGVLQAELARVEAERQRLADQLGAGDSGQIQRLQEANRELHEQLQAIDLHAQAQREDQRRKWFMIGGGTVAGCLLLGFIVGRSGGRRQRKEWIN